MLRCTDAAPRSVSWEVTVAVLFAAAIHAGWNAMVKRGRDPLLETTLVYAWAALPALAAVMVLPWPGTTALLHVAASSGVHVLYYHALAAAYRDGDLSFAYPLMRGTAPMATAILAVPLLGEWPSVAGAFGIAAVCAGVLTIGLAQPPAGGRAARDRAFGWAMVTAATIVASTLIDSSGARAASSPWAYVAWLALVQGPLMAMVVGWRRGVALIDHARARGPGPLAIGIASMGAYGVALWAMTRAPVAMVAALRETSVVFALLIASAMLGERIGQRRWFGAIAVVGGVVALRLA